MKPWLRFIPAPILGLIAVVAADAQVVRVEMTSPINESAIAYNPGAAVATATATIVPAGQVAGVTIGSAGTGFTGTPTVTFTGGGGTGAAGTATIGTGTASNTIIEIKITNPGTSYTSAPTVEVTGGGGTGFSGTVNLTPGAVTALTLTSPGSGFTSPPTVAFTGGGGTGAQATATIVDGKITSIALTSGGTGYVTVPTVVIAQPAGIVTIEARVTGTDLFATQFFVDGKPVSTTIGGSAPQTFWNPPQPGAYFVTAKTTDAYGNSATAQAVRVFVPGAKIFSPLENTLVPLGSSVVISADGLFADGTPTTPTQHGGLVRQIEFFVNGLSIGIDNAAPYSSAYTPPALGVYNLTAVATDNYGNTASAAAVPVRVVAPIGSPPRARIANPVDNGSVAAGNVVNIIADASDDDGIITKVEFYLNGVLLGSDTTFPFTSSWTPAVPGRYLLLALVFDDKGNVTTTAPTNVVVTGGLPSVQVNAPSPGATIVQGATVKIDVGASGSDGGITTLKTIELLIDGVVSDTLPKAPPSTGLNDAPPVLTEPFTFNWKSNVPLGTHRIAARVTDVNNLTITSAELTVNVIANQPPQVAITAPSPASSLAVNAGTTIAASASDVDGTVDSVEFFVDGVSIGTATKAPFQINWTPTSAGTFSFTAKATDNGSASTTSSAVVVTVDPPPASGGSVIANTVFRGDYGSSAETGRFALGVNRNNRGTFIAFSTAPTGRTYFWTDFPVNPDGTFAVRDSAGKVLLSGQTSATGVSGLFDGKTFIGPITLGSGTFSPMLLSGTLAGSPTSQVVAVVGGDGSITLYAATGTSREAGSDFLTTSGAYTISTPTGGRFTGTVTQLTNVISGAVSGSVTGTFLLQQQPSRIVNISTRSLAGTGDRTLVAGFVIRGTGTKPLLIRGVGPTLANFGVTNPLADPFLSILSRTGVVATNNDWGNSAALSAAATQVGAFALNAGSRDAAAQVTVAPGVYTAVVDGATATPGLALIELYDTQSTAGTAQIANISTRGQVSGADAMIAGFVISGDQRKRLLIRAVGPTLSNFGIAGALADPKLEVVSGSTVIVSNNDWTEPASLRAVTSTGSAVGAFPLADNSRDAALVVQLNPGAYTVQVTGVGGATGTVLVEIYDADL